jgi:transposase-like protein
MNENHGFHDVMRWTDEECRTFLEAQRWPNGPICPKCGETDPYTITRKSATKNAVRTLYKCRACRKQYTATVGTIFEDSHIALSKWFAAIYLMCSSKKGVSAHQIHRSLGVTYKSAWFMCHRVREAMKDSDGSPLVGIIEADETYVGGKTRRGHPVANHERRQIEAEARGEKPQHILRGKRHPRMDKAVVFGMIERGGRVRSMHVPDAKQRTLRPIMITNIDVKHSRLITDSAGVYKVIKHDMPHDIVDHSVEYVNFDRPDVHTQGIENYWSIVKRGVVGIFHHVGVPYLDQYLREFDFRFNRRKISDAERFASLVSQVSGRRLTWYCQTPLTENPYA